MDHKKSTGKMAKALAEFKFRHYVNIFLWNRATVMRLRYVRHCTLSDVGTTGGLKQIGTHNRSENGRSAWVTL
jgi:hypothetical protein